MKRYSLSLGAAAFFAVGLSLAGLEGCGKASAQTLPQAGVDRSIQLTVYKQDFAMVREGRPLHLALGRNRLRLDGVSKQLDPHSVIFDWGAGDRLPQLVSNTYDIGVGSGQGLMKRLEGKAVQMVWNSNDGHPGQKVDGILEATGDAGFVLRAGDKLYINPNATLVAPSDSGVVTMPALTAEVDSPAAEDAKLSVGYLTRGLSWSSDYVAKLAPEGDSLQLECWATVENHTGIDYPNAKIVLMAGSPNRAAVSDEGSGRSVGGAMAMSRSPQPEYKVAKGAPAMLAQPSGELYAYNVDSAASIGQEQMNRVRMLSATKVPIKKDYSIHLRDVSGWYWESGNANPIHQTADLAISFVNDSKGGLGVPLPVGAVRVYDAPASGEMAYVGAADLGDIPKSQHVNLTLSKVFDVYSDTKLLKSSRIDKRTVRKTMEVDLHNAKKGAVVVRLVQDFYGNPKLVSESIKSVKPNGASRQWTVSIPAGGETKLTYAIDLRG